MIRATCITTILSAVLLGCASTGSRPGGTNDVVAQAAGEAQAADRILLAYFTAAWCGPCRRMKSDTLADPRVQRWIGEHGRFLEVDIDHHEAAAAALDVQGIPVTIAFRDSEEMDRIEGYRAPEEFLQWLDDLAAGTVRLARLRRLVQEQAEAGHVDLQAQYALAEELMRRGLHDESAQEYAKLWPHIRGKTDGRVNLELLVPHDMRRLVKTHPPAAERFRVLRDELPNVIEDRSADDWTVERWLTLSAIMRDQEALVTWMESREDEEFDRRRQMMGWLAGVRFFGWGDMYEAAVDLGRWDLVLRLRESRARMWHGTPDVVLLNRGSQQTWAGLLRRLHPISHDELRETMRYEAATLHAACLAAGRDAEARAVADELLRRLNDAESRLELVEQASRAGRVHHYHRVWLAEARVRLKGRDDRVARLEEVVVK